MRKLKVFESISLDGFFTGPGDDMSFAHAGQADAEFNVWVASNAGAGGALLFGRKTYQMMAAFWPTPAAAAQMPDVARGMNAAKKYVVSHDLQPEWQNTEVLRGELAPTIRELKAQPGADITVLGSGSVAAQLGAAGLVDEYQFVIVPIALGAGRSVFSQQQRLRLLSQRAFPGGNLVVTYAA